MTVKEPKPHLRVVSAGWVERNGYTISQTDRCPQCGFTPNFVYWTCRHCNSRFIHASYPRWCAICRKPWKKIKCSRCSFVMERIFVDGIGEVFLGPQRRVDTTNPLYWTADPKRGINYYV